MLRRAGIDGGLGGQWERYGVLLVIMELFWGSVGSVKDGVYGWIVISDTGEFKMNYTVFDRLIDG